MYDPNGAMRSGTTLDRAFVRDTIVDRLDTDDAAATLYEDDVTPASEVFAYPLAGSDHPKAGARMQCEAGGVRGEDPARYGPDTRGLG